VTDLVHKRKGTPWRSKSQNKTFAKPHQPLELLHSQRYPHRICVDTFSCAPLAVKWVRDGASVRKKTRKQNQSSKPEVAQLVAGAFVCVEHLAAMAGPLTRLQLLFFWMGLLETLDAGDMTESSTNSYA